MHGDFPLALDACVLANGRLSAGDALRTPRFLCQRCTNCCRWPGFVKVTDDDIARIAGFLGIEEREFIARFTRLRPSRDGLALTEHPDGACIFLDGRDCRIQAVKPLQCAGFPNTWNFPGWRDVCEAIEAIEADQASLAAAS